MPTTIELALRRDLNAPSIARAAASGGCRGLDLSATLCHTLVLLVSELVSNAVLHSNAPAETPIIFTTVVTQDTIRVTVADAGDLFIPQPRKPERTNGGYGLYLVDKAAHRWGVDPHDRAHGTRVWFELCRDA
jgi:anti-sigma regulatory factor (Ser/Thr protein kinase)